MPIRSPDFIYPSLLRLSPAKFRNEYGTEIVELFRNRCRREGLFPILSVVNSIVLRPLPFQDPDRLVWIWDSNPSRGLPRFTTRALTFLDWKRDSRSFGDLAACNAPLPTSALSHPTRIAILEVLREGEISARVIQERLGIEQANLSQHLAILRSRQIVATRKQGNHVFYSLRNKVLIKVLELMRQYFQAHLHEAAQMLGEIEAERPIR